MSLPVQPPFAPMDALLVDEIPEGDVWQYEPKWDGFRCLVFRDGKKTQLQSKSGQSLTRYFPELVEAFLKLETDRFVLDGEIAVPVDQHLSFDDLLQRIHPAESRVRKLASQTPALFIAFDLLVDAPGRDLLNRPLSERRKALERFSRHFAGTCGRLRLSPSTNKLSSAKKWFGRVGNQRKRLLTKLEPLIETPGFTGNAPGGPSRWSTKRSTEWEPLRPELVIEVSYDHFTSGRFRHGTSLIRWRPDKAPEQCTMDQVSKVGAGSMRLPTKPPSPTMPSRPQSSPP